MLAYVEVHMLPGIFFKILPQRIKEQKDIRSERDNILIIVESE